MLMNGAAWGTPSIFLQSNPHRPQYSRNFTTTTTSSSAKPLQQLYSFSGKDQSFRCKARRRVRYEEEEEEDGSEGSVYNPEIAVLEFYSQSVRHEALIVKATVDDSEEEEILIFKGFASSLTYGTSPDPAKSILPARALIRSIDRIKGPFSPNNIEYIEKGLSFDDLKARLRPS